MATLRTAREIAHRIRQEVKNAYACWRPPEFGFDPGWRPRLRLPDAAAVAQALRGTAFAGEVIGLAGHVREHRFPIFGSTVDTGPAIPWRRDHLSGIETDLRYFRRIPYLHASRAGDHKTIWELNRHQQLVILAQAYRFTGDVDNLGELRGQLE